MTAHAYDDKLEETGKYRIFARLKPATEVANGMASSPPTLEETPLLPGGGELTYRGRLTAPPISALKTESPAPSSSLRSMVLEVIAYDGDYIAGRGELDVQVLDDSAEYRDLRPDPERLEELAQISGGRVLHNSQRVEPAAGEHQAGGGRSGHRPPARLGQSRPVVPLAPAVDGRMDVPPLPRAGVRFRHRGNSFRQIMLLHNDPMRS